MHLLFLVVISCCDNDLDHVACMCVVMKLLRVSHAVGISKHIKCMPWFYGDYLSPPTVIFCCCCFVQICHVLV